MRGVGRPQRNVTCIHLSRSDQIPQADDKEFEGTDIERNSSKKFKFDKLAQELSDLGIENSEAAAQALGSAGLVRVSLVLVPQH